jgi:hypothetical protein
MAKDIICTLATFDKSNNSRKVAWVLGVDRRNNKGTTKNQSSLINNGDFFGLIERLKSRVIICVMLQSNCEFLDYRNYSFSKCQGCHLKESYNQAI